MLIASLVLAASSVVSRPNLELELVRHSLTGTHYRYRQVIDGIPVVGGEVNVTVAPTGLRTEARSLAVKSSATRTDSSRTLVNVNGVARPAQRVITQIDDVRRIVRYFDSETNALLAEETNFSHKTGRVFDPNPVTKLNDPSLRDNNDAASAVPGTAYSDVELLDLAPSGPLRGPHVQIVDTQNPAIAPVDGSQSLIFDREDDGFEDVNAYFHIDKTQRHLQSLGFRGDRAIAPYAIEVDVHAAAGQDNSFFAGSVSTPGRGTLFFGDGGTDDAEDSDLVVHEYGHAIHDWISPGTFLGGYNTQARAIGEALGDYLAMSASYAAAISSGRDPLCIAEWDARCWTDASSEQCGYPAGSDCLRRMDSGRTMAELSDINQPGTEYRNAEIWSSALRSVFVALTERYGIEEGRRTSDTIVVESLFGVPPGVSFAGMASRMIAVDRVLNNSANADVICAAMTARGILDGCGVMPRGELTVFQSRERAVEIPDGLSSPVTLSTFVTDTRLIERVFVNVNIEHQSRGDLRIVLLAPDGSEFVLLNTTLDRAPDVRTTYGRDAVPVESLAPLRGRSAAGEWKLQVTDFFTRDVGRVLSWSLIIQFAGEEPLQVRPPKAAQRSYIPVAGSTRGLDGTFFRSELRLINPGTRATTATVTFTPSAADGRFEFGSVDVEVAAGATVVFDDVVRNLFNTSGTGQIEIAGDVLATSRISSGDQNGTYGEIVPSELVTGEGQRNLNIRYLPPSRSAIGFAEVNGEPGIINVNIVDAQTGQVTQIVHSILPFSHVQVPAPGYENGSSASISVFSGNAAIVAYGSASNPLSGDPSYIPATAEPPTTPPGALAPAINGLGASATWRTSLLVMNHSIKQELAEVFFVDPVTRSKRLVVATELPIARGIEVPDVIGTEPNRGVLQAGERNAVSILARSFSGVPEDRFGHFIPFEVPQPGPRELPYIESSEDFRTNIGLLTDVDSIVRVTIHDSAGVQVSRQDYVLQPLVLFQFTVPIRVVGGRARVEVLSGRVYPYASVIDNRTGDPSFVRPE